MLVDGLLKVGPGKTKKILEESLESHGIFSQKRCMNPVIISHCDRYITPLGEKGIN